MKTLESLKRSIGSAKDLESVVRTMKTLAAVSIRQYEEAVDSLVEYSLAVELGLQMVLWDIPAESQLLAPHDAGRAALIVFGSDQGMCGQFNERVTAYATNLIHQAFHRDEKWHLLTLGSRVSGNLCEAGCEIDRDLHLPSSASGISDVIFDVLSILDDWQTLGSWSRLLVVYNRRLSAASYQPHHVQLLPINLQPFLRSRARSWKSRSLPSFSMKRGELFSRLIQQHLFISLFRACAESLAGENASRIASMQAAERNIQDRLSELQREFHQQRQSSITEELLDVVTGYEALSQSQ